MGTSSYYVRCIFTVGEDVHYLSSRAGWTEVETGNPGWNTELLQEGGTASRLVVVSPQNERKALKKILLYSRKPLVIFTYLPACLPAGIFFPW